MTDGPITLSIDVSATAHTVWRLLVEPEGLAQWWGVAQVDLRSGGIFRVQMSEGPQPVMSGVVVSFIENRRLVLDFGWEPTTGAPDLAPASSRVEIDIVALGDGVRVTLEHHQLPRDLREETALGWSDHLDRLCGAALDDTTT